MAMGALTAWGISALINAGLILPVTRVPVLTRRGWWHAWALGTVLGATLGWQGWLAVVCIGAWPTVPSWFCPQGGTGDCGSPWRRGPENVWGS